MSYLVAPRNYDRDFGGRTPGFGDMDEYGLPRGMSPEDKREVLDRFPLPGEQSKNAETGKRDFLYQYLEQNKEVMGPKNQTFGRYANPDDGTLNNDEMARVDPTDKLLLKSLRKGEIGDPNSPRIRKAIIDLEKKIYNDGRASSMDGDLMAGMPRYIRGHQYAPRGVIMTVPDIDSRIFNERVKRGFVPMTPPPSRGGGPQLPGFV